MTLVGELVEAVSQDLGVEATAVTRIGGGDVAESVRIDLVTGGAVFAKTHASPPAGFFTTEAWGLRWLRDAAALPVPEVLAVSDAAPARLVLAWIDEGRGPGRPPAGFREDTEAAFGRGLAVLHRAGAPTFGREDRRTTGSRALPNEPCRTWVEFYATQRLLPLARLARDGRALPEDVVADLERLAGRLEAVAGPVEPPARLHGDLWAGNRLVDAEGRSWLVDPAAHGGHREFDLAMMALFGGFGPACWEGYDDVFALAPGWRERVPLHQVAPLVVHAVKFGGGYVGAAADAIRRSV